MLPDIATSSTREKINIEKKVSVDAFKAYCWGDHYPEQWREKIETGSGATGGNYWGFLFSYRWCLFRKMTQLGLVLFLIEAIAYTVAILAVKERYVDALTAGFAFVGVELLLMAFVGLFGNKFYFQKAHQEIKTISTSMISQEQFGEILRSKGGVSMIGLTLVQGIGVVIGTFVSSL